MGDNADGRIGLLQHSALTPRPKELGRKALGLEQGSRAKALNISSTRRLLSLLHSAQSHTPTRCFCTGELSGHWSTEHLAIAP